MAYGPWISDFEIIVLPWMNPIRTRIRKTRIVFHVRIRPSMILWSPKRTRLDIDPGVFYTCSLNKKILLDFSYLISSVKPFKSKRL